MVLPLWEGSGENKEVLETRLQGLFSGPTLSRFACWPVGDVPGMRKSEGGLWVGPRDSHSGNSHLASHLPSPWGRGVTPGAQAFPGEGW